MLMLGGGEKVLVWKKVKKNMRKGDKGEREKGRKGEREKGRKERRLEES